MNVYFNYSSGLAIESGKLFVDSNSSLYGSTIGEIFLIQFNPINPSRYYCCEARSLSRTFRRTIQVIGITFAIFVMIIDLLAHSGH